MPIFDQGYQHWKGELSGHAWRWLAITRQGLRGSLKGSISPIRVILVFAYMPALVLVVVIALWGMFEQGSQTIIDLFKSILPPGFSADPHAYRHAVWTISYSFFFRFEMFFFMLIVVIVGPNLVSRDLRYNALPLYFSRPLTRLDYFLGKLGVIAALVAAVAVVPAVAAYVLGVCFSLDLSVIRDTWRLLPASILYGLVIVVSAGTLMLALSSLSRRSLYVGIAWVGLWVISTAVSAVLSGIHQGALYQGIVREEMARGKYSDSDNQYYDPDEPSSRRNRQGRSSELWHRAQERMEQVRAEAAKTDWRPLCSYTANLQRMGEALLDTDSAWVEVGRALEVPRAAFGPMLAGSGTKANSAQINNRRLADMFAPQYPWTWSAGVLAGLLGISIWTLTRRVKTLDRLQ
jgi:ABC-2 type transport system permease protein